MADFPALNGGGRKTKGDKAPASRSPSWGRGRTAAATQRWPGLSGGTGPPTIRAPAGPSSSSAGFAGASTAGRGRGRGRGRSSGDRGVANNNPPPPRAGGRGWGKVQEKQQQPASSWPGLHADGGVEAGGGGEGRGETSPRSESGAQDVYTGTTTGADAYEDAGRQQQQFALAEQPLLEGGALIQKAADRVEVVGLRSFASVQ